MQVMTQFSVYLINKPGVLAAVTGALAEANVNIIALALMDAGEHGALRMVCDDADKTRKVLNETHDRWTEAEVLALEMDNRPGGFSELTRKLAAERTNITYAYFSGTQTRSALAPHCVSTPTRSPSRNLVQPGPS